MGEQNVEKTIRDWIGKEIGPYLANGLTIAYRTDSPRCNMAILTLGDASDTVSWPKGPNAHQMRLAIKDVRSALHKIGAIESRPQRQHRPALATTAREAAEALFRKPQTDGLGIERPRWNDTRRVKPETIEQPAYPEIVQKILAAQPERPAPAPAPKITVEFGVQPPAGAGTKGETVETPATVNGRSAPVVVEDVETPEAKESGHKRLRRQDITELMAFYLENGKRDKARGLYTFNSGVTDDDARKAVRPDIDTKIVTEYRREHVGRTQDEIDRANAARTAGDPGARAAALEARVAALESQNETLHRRLARLESDLGVK